LILVADDSPTVQRKAQGILRAEGFEVETVSNGVAAIKKLPNLQPILVLADVSMPGKDGYEVCEFVKTSADFRHVPVLLVGSDLEPYDEQRGAQVKADGIIKKPFDPSDLIAMVAKFTGLGQASQPTVPGTLVASSAAGLPEVSLQPSPEPELEMWPQSLPEPLPVTPPEDVLGGSSEPLPASTEPFPGFAFGVTPEPTPEGVPEAAPEPALVGPELISGTTLEAIPEPTPAIAEPTLESIPEAAPESASTSPELISETTLEAMPEPTLVIPGPIPEFMPEAPPEPALGSPELIFETAPEAAAEQVSGVSEPVAESGLPFAPESVTETVYLPAEAAAEAPPALPVEEVPPPTEPIWAEKLVEPIPSLAPSPDLGTAEADRTMVSPAPAEIAEPVLVDELAPTPPALEPPPLVEGQRRQPMAATHMDSFPLTEAAEGQVYAAPPETEAGPAREAEAAKPSGAAAGAPSVVDREWVYVIVHRVMMKMAPPMLPPEVVEELIRVLAREITAELDAASSQNY
jgi:CheY-like chemotaxis protein